MNDDQYKVGYAKPPEHTKFQKGQSGNPNGRPINKEPLNMLETLKTLLSNKTSISENGVSIKITLYEAYLRRLVTSAINGKSSEIKLLYTTIKEIDALDRKDIRSRSVVGEILDSIAKNGQQPLPKISGTREDRPSFRKEETPPVKQEELKKPPGLQMPTLKK